MLKKAVVTSLLAIVTAMPASAGGVEPGLISAKAKWVAHLDIAGLRQTGLGKLLTEKLQEDSIQARIAEFSEAFGFDPQKDLDSITLWGVGYQPDQGIAMFTGTFDRDKLLALLDAAEGHTALEHGEHVIHRWTQQPEDLDDDGVRHGVIYRKDVVMIARSGELLKSALDQLATEDGTLADPEAPELLPKRSKGTFLFLSGTEMGRIAEGRPKAKWTRLVSSAHVEMGQDGKTVFANCRMTAKDPRNAKRLRNVLSGLVAMIQLQIAAAEENDQPVPFWAPLADAVEFGGEGRAVTMSLAMEQEQLLEIVRKAKEAKARRAEEGDRE